MGSKKRFMRRTGVRVSMFRNFIIHHIFSEFLQSLPRCRNTTGLTVSIVVSFLFGFGFWVGLGNNGSPRSIFNILDTSTGWESIPLRSSLSRVSLSLNTVEVGEMDELEEDVGWLLSCLESVIDVDEQWELDEELGDKPGTTMGTKFSVLQSIRIPFLMRCGFWPLIHS